MRGILTLLIDWRWAWVVITICCIFIYLHDTGLLKEFVRIIRSSDKEVEQWDKDPAHHRRVAEGIAERVRRENPSPYTKFWLLGALFFLILTIVGFTS